MCRTLSARGLPLLVTALLGLGACSTDSRLLSDRPDGAAAPQPAAAALSRLLPAPPLDDYVAPAQILSRRGAAIGELEVPGSLPVLLGQTGTQIDAAEHTCQLSASGAGSLAWAVYQFSDLLDADSPLLLHLELGGNDPGGPAYVAVADFTRRAWVWTSLPNPQDSNNIPIPAGPGAINAGGDCYVAVAVFEQGSLAVQKLRLALDCPAPPPDGFAVSPGDGVQTPVSLSWIDPAISFDPDGAGQEVFAYDGILIQRAEAPEGPWNDLTQLDPGVVSYDDPNSVVIPGGEYYYRLLTLVGGTVHLPGIILGGRSDLGLIQLQARLSPAPASGAAPLNVSFSASASTVSGAPLSHVQWDYDGDGVWDKDTLTVLSSSHSYPAAGRFRPRVRLVMDLGGGTTRSDTVAAYVAVGDKRGEWNQYGRTGGHLFRTALRGPGSTPTPLGFAGTQAFATPACLSDGTILAPSQDSKLYYIRPDGSLLRGLDLGLHGVGSPAVTAGGYVWLPTSVDLFSPRLSCVWPDLTVHTQSPGSLAGPAAVSSDGRSIYVSADNKLYCAPENGNAGGGKWYSWTYSFPAGSLASVPALDASGNIYVCAGTGLFKLSSAGKLLWKQEGFSFELHNPSVGGDGNVYVTLIDAPLDLLAFDSSGYNLWGQSLFSGSEKIVGGAACAADGSVYVATSEGRVFCFTSLGGMPYLPFHDATLSFNGPPLLDAEGRLYLFSKDGRIQSLTSKLVPRWNVSLGELSAGSGLALGNDGALLAAAQSKLYIVR